MFLGFNNNITSTRGFFFRRIKNCSWYPDFFPVWFVIGFLHKFGYHEVILARQRLCCLAYQD